MMPVNPEKNFLQDLVNVSGIVHPPRDEGLQPPMKILPDLLRFFFHFHRQPQEVSPDVPQQAAFSDGSQQTACSEGGQQILPLAVSIFALPEKKRLRFSGTS
jgi:hypothetical protein